MNEHDTSSFLKPVNHAQYYTPFGSLSSESYLSKPLRSSIVFCYNRANILMKSALEASWYSNIKPGTANIIPSAIIIYNIMIQY